MKPTKQQFQTVIDKLDGVLPLSLFECHLNMSAVGVPSSKKEVCGTPMCHGGWYAAASGLFRNSNNVNKATYNDGANVLANDLGFVGQCELEDWAEENPKLWGNESGTLMFCTSEAFNGATSLKQIRDWWADVRNRCYPQSKPLAHV